MDSLQVARGVLRVARFAVRVDDAKVSVLGAARGVGDGTLRSEPPIIRMALGIRDGARQAHRAHQMSPTAMLINAAYDVIGHVR